MKKYYLQATLVGVITGILILVLLYWFSAVGCDKPKFVEYEGRIENLNIYSVTPNQPHHNDTTYIYRIPAHTEGYFDFEFGIKELLLKPCDTSWNEDNCVYSQYNDSLWKDKRGMVMFQSVNKNLFHWYYKLILVK